LPCIPKVPSPGFGYPLDGFRYQRTLGSLFQLPTLLGFALQSFSPLVRSKEAFASFLSALALPSANPSRLGRGASAVSSRSRSRTPFCFPEGLVRGGAACSPGLFDLSGSPVATPDSKFLSSKLPSRPFAANHLTITGSRNPRGFSRSGLAFPSEEGAGLSGLFHRPSCPAF
jgi:hypothetical protein